jgi:hypothetical protein
MIIFGKNILNPNDFSIKTEFYDLGNFYGDGYYRDYIEMDVDFNIEDLDNNDLSFCFSTNEDIELYFHTIPENGFGSIKCKKIKIYDCMQENYSFEKLTDGILRKQI